MINVLLRSGYFLSFLYKKYKISWTIIIPKSQMLWTPKPNKTYILSYRSATLFKFISENGAVFKEWFIKLQFGSLLSQEIKKTLHFCSLCLNEKSNFKTAATHTSCPKWCRRAFYGGLIFLAIINEPFCVFI